MVNSLFILWYLQSLRLTRRPQECPSRRARIPRRRPRTRHRSARRRPRGRPGGVPGDVPGVPGDVPLGQETSRGDAGGGQETSHWRSIWWGIWGPIWDPIWGGQILSHKGIKVRHRGAGSPGDVFRRGFGSPAAKNGPDGED